MSTIRPITTICVISIAQAQNKLLNKRDQIPIDSILVDIKVTLYRSISFYLINPFCDFK